MADQDDFTFDEQDSDSEEWYEEEPQKKKKSGGSRSRILLLLLLLVAIAGGGYYFTMMPADDEGPAAPTKAVVKIKKKPIAMPNQPKTIAKAPAPAEPPAKAGPKPALTPGQKEPAAMPGKSAQLPVQQQPVPVPVQIDEKPAAVVPEMQPKPVFEPADPAPPAKMVMPATGAYTLTAGTYLLQSSVASISKKISSLGYEPVITPVKREVTMTRLKLGTYPLAEAAAKVAELKAVAPGAFSIRSGNQETVYAGSYVVLDKARRFADALYKKGISLEEEPVQVKKTLHRVTFGGFASQDEAKSAGRQAAAKGVEAQAVKNR